MKMRNLPSDPMIELASDVDSYFAGEKVHFFGIDYSGQREMQRFLNALAKYANSSFIFTSSGVGMDDRMDKRFGEFRKIRGLEDYTCDDKTTNFVAVENTAKHTGRSAISGPIGILYGMHEELIPGKGYVTVYLMTTDGDTIGVSNFAALREFRKYKGVKKHMKNIAHATYLDLSERGMIEQISERKPEIRLPRSVAVVDTLDRLGDIVREAGALML